MAETTHPVRAAHRCPKCREPIEQANVGGTLMWFCPRRTCSTVYDSLPTQLRAVD